MQGGLHGVDDLPWQEGRDDDGLGLAAALAHECLELHVVEQVADRAIAHAVVARGVVDGVGGRELRLGSLYAGEVEVALLFGRDDDAVDVHFGLGGHRVERTASGGDGRGVQGAGILDEGFLDVLDDGGDLRHVVDLTVEHSAGLVFLPLRGYDVQSVILAFLGDDADDAARADIQRENIVVMDAGRTCRLRGLAARRAFFRGRARRLAWAAGAAFCRCGIFYFGCDCFRHEKISLLTIFLEVIGNISRSI